MILLLSRNDDGTTSIVSEWLVSLKQPFLRINADDERTRIVLLDVAGRLFIIDRKGKHINLLDATSVWYRRRGFSLKSMLSDSKRQIDPGFFEHKHYAKNQLTEEMKVLREYMYHLLESNCTHKIGSYFNASLNKLMVLELAKSLGLMIPSPVIVTNKGQLEELMSSGSSHYITKPLDNGVYLFTDRFGYYSYTERISENPDMLPQHFFPSLVQAEVKKKYELRCFYLKGTFYSMAIFSQKDPQTSIDMRKYNNIKPNRAVPYKIPEPVASKLKALMDKLNLDTGSLDIIVDTEGNYIFLEINPVGQFSVTSYCCNYYLEKKIARILTYGRAE